MLKHTKRSRQQRVAALVCALSVAVAACGDDDDDADAPAATDAAGSTDAPVATDAPDTTEAPTATDATEATDATDAPASSEAPATTDAAEPTGEATGTPIKIGLLYSETGRTASAYSMTDDVALAWADHVNSTKAGIGGHPVEIVALDVASDVAVAAEKAREAVESEGVVGIIIQDSNTETAVREYLAGAGVPVIGGTSNAWSPDVPATEFVVSSTPPGSYGLGPLAAAAAGATGFGAIACSEVPSCNNATEYYEQVVPELGLNYAPTVLASHSEANYTAPCLTMVNAGVDFMPLSFAPAVVGIVAAECYLQGFQGYIGGTANTVDEDIFRANVETIPGFKSAGYLNGFPWWADHPAVEEFRTVTDGIEAPTLNPSATITWSTLELLRKVLNDSGVAPDAEVTAADVVGLYQATSGETLDGLLPQPLDFTSGPQGVPCGWLFEFDGETFRTLTVGDSGNGAEGDLQTSCSDVGS